MLRRFCSLFKSYEDEEITSAKRRLHYEIKSTRFGAQTNTIFSLGIDLLSSIPYLKTSKEHLQFEIILVGTAIVAMAREDAKYGPQLEYNNEFLYPHRLHELLKLCQIEISAKPEWEEYDNKMKTLIEKVGHKALIEKSLPFDNVIKPTVVVSLGPLIKTIEMKYEKLSRQVISASLELPMVLNQLVGDYLHGQSMIVGEYVAENDSEVRCKV